MTRPLSIISALLLAGLVIIGTSGVAMAFPGSATGTGNSCATCHGADGGQTDRADAMSVTGETEFDPLEPDPIPPWWTDRGALQTFTAQPGDTITLTMQVNDGDKAYAVQLKRFEKQGLGGNILEPFITPDASWNPQATVPGAAETYYTSIDGFSGHDWPLVAPGGPDPFTFTLTLAPDTPLDVYDLEFAAAGHVTAGDRWYDDEHFYLNVVAAAAPLSFELDPGIDPASADDVLDRSSSASITGLSRTGENTLGIINYDGEPDGNMDIWFELSGLDSDGLDALALELEALDDVGSASQVAGSPFLGTANLAMTLVGGGTAGDHAISYSFGDGVTVSAAAVPEPSAILLALLTLVSLSLGRRRMWRSE